MREGGRRYSLGLFKQSTCSHTRGGIIRQKIKGYRFSSDTKGDIWRFHVRLPRSSVVALTTFGVVVFLMLAGAFIRALSAWVNSVAAFGIAELLLLCALALLVLIFTVVPFCFIRGVRVQLNREGGAFRLKGPFYRMSMSAAEIEAVIVSLPVRRSGPARVLLLGVDGVLRTTSLDFRLSKHADMFEEVALPAGRALADALGKPLLVRRELPRGTEGAIRGWRRKRWLGGLPAQMAEANRQRLELAPEYLGCSVAENERGFTLATPRDPTATGKVLRRYALYIFLCFISLCVLNIVGVVIMLFVLGSFFRAWSATQPIFLATDAEKGTVFLDRGRRRSLSQNVESVTGVCLEVVDGGEVFFGTLGVRFEGQERFHIPLAIGPLGSPEEVLSTFRPLARALAEALGTSVKEAAEANAEA